MVLTIESALKHSTSVSVDIRVCSRSESLGGNPSSSAASVSDSQGERSELSLLGRQLSDSAHRSNQREHELSREELAAYAKKQLGRISLDGYQAGKYQHDLERPNTDDAEHLVRAIQSTEFVNRVANGGCYTKNPFAGLSGHQLALISYDDSGTYTINERRAALYESSRLKYEWTKEAVTRCQLESAQTGRIPVFLTEVLNYYKGLSKIEQLQDCYPDNYVVELEAKIQVELSRPSGDGRELTEQGLNLYDILAMIFVPEEKVAKINEQTATEKNSPGVSSGAPPFNPDDSRLNAATEGANSNVHPAPTTNN